MTYPSQVCFRQISGVSEAYLRYITPDYRTYVGQISGIYHAYLSHIQTYKCLLNNDIISLNIISFDISLLFIDTEIFAAYAGSCLLKFVLKPTIQHIYP